ncbi:MAG: hypothetical protein IT448_09145 [Phycisphaerales bacterium]|nr:hypothetical protein [Phycisphaerales bacterium]
MFVAFFNQTFVSGDLAIIGLLILLEGVLSIDNAMVLGLLAKRLPEHKQKRALFYGLLGAFVFRILAIVLAAYLLHWWWAKMLGGAYLVYIAIKHFLPARQTDHHHEHTAVGSAPVGSIDTHTADQPARATPAAPRRKYPNFWLTVLTIELTDIAFAIDSILAAIAMIPGTTITPNPKLWVVICGGMLGVILMRFAAVVFIRLLNRFPQFEVSAYLLVMLIGCKLLAEWWFNKPPAGYSSAEVYHGRLQFHNFHNPAFWVFWGLMLLCLLIGFMPARKKEAASHNQKTSPFAPAQAKQ